MKHWIIDFLMSTVIFTGIISLGLVLNYSLAVLVRNYQNAAVVFVVCGAVTLGAIATRQIRKEF